MPPVARRRAVPASLFLSTSAVPHGVARAAESRGYLYHRKHCCFWPTTRHTPNRKPLIANDTSPLSASALRPQRRATSWSRAASAAALLCCAAIAHAAPADCPARVRVSFPNFEFAPYVLGTDKIHPAPGLLVEWTRNAIALTGCKPAVTIQRRPANRQLVELQLGLLDILPGFAYADELTDRLAFPMRGAGADPSLLVIADELSLFVRADDRSIKWDGMILTGFQHSVGMSTGGPGKNRLIAAYNWPIEVASTPAENLRKLVAGRLDVILEPNMVLEPCLRGADAKAVRKLSPPVLVTDRYAPVGKRFEAAHPEFTHAFWREICKQARAGTPAQRECK